MRNFFTITLLIAGGFFSSEISAQCNAKFVFNNKSCQGKEVTFTSKDTGTSTRFLWNFGDAFSGTLNSDSNRNPKHYFNTSGKFTITLIVSNKSCHDTQQAILYVYTNPKADFLRINGCVDLATRFINKTAVDTADKISQWQWDFGSGDTSSLFSPSRIYKATGTKHAQLIAVSAAGCRDTTDQNFTVFKKPTATRKPATICQNGQIDFTGDTISAAYSYHWDFGDSSNYSQNKVSHVYKKTGTIHPVFSVDFNTTTCSIIADSIIVNANPDAGFKTNRDTQCFLGNKLCVVQKNMNQKIKQRNVIFDDGFLDDFTPLNIATICHSYTDTAGGYYSITLELTDSNNCTASNTLKKGVLIYPTLNPGFSFTTGNGCFKTDVLIKNESKRTPPAIGSFHWDFGDGKSDSSTWTNVKHTYTANGSFSVILTVKDKHGCVESVTGNQSVNNTSYVVDAHIDSISGHCKNNNLTFFKQTPIAGASIEWHCIYPDVYKTFNPVYRFNYPGVYYPWVKISKNGCDSILQLDSVVIHGPVASALNVQNRYQCYIKDTVYFQNTSLLFRNKSSVVFWDAGDPFGPSCTTSLPDTLNIGKNCRYSRDSLKFKHMYQPGQENCYFAKIRVADTVLGCMDSTYISLALKPPKAKGLFIPSSNANCPGAESYKTLYFDPRIPEPSCIKYAWWVMWDSLEAVKSGNFNAYWQGNPDRHNYGYANYAGDSNGYVTIGLVVENGVDTNGKACRDTGWFHNVVKVTRVNPNFTTTYDPSIHYCSGSTYYFFLRDSLQNKGTTFTWNFGDGTTYTTTDPSYVKHRFKTSGSFRVRLIATAPNGCVTDSSIEINIGVKPNFTTSANAKCVGETLQLSENILYENSKTSPVGMWRNSARIASGKEHLWYDLGDGKGFQDIGPIPNVKFDHPGIYGISMVTRDSAGCMDTLRNALSINISGVYAGFTIPGDTVLCAQSLQLKSTATVTDSAVMKSLPGDKIIAWEYNFGSVYPISSSQNPLRYFATGTYAIRQIVTNAYGCRDTSIRSMTITGPMASYDIVGDTIGCAPLTINFKNNSRFATSFIWQFNDINNNSFSTNSDTNVSLKYKGYGSYFPKLVARGSFTRNGVSRVCDAIYPDTSIGLKKSVVVYELPTPNFSWSTNCATGTTSFKNTSTINSALLDAQKWYFGDGDSSLAQNPTHKYKDTGTYKIVLKIRSQQGCEDSIIRKIVVSPTPVPWFGYNYNCFGTPSLFRDSSFAYNDKIFKWSWDFGDGTSSTQKNPAKLFAKDTTFNVKLTVTNIAGCTENVTRSILIYSKPRPVFSYQNQCDKNIFYFKNNSTSKQTIQNWKWSTGDGNYQTTWNDSHSYSTPGNYKVKLVLKTVNGCMDSLVQNAVSYPKPKAIIYLKDSLQCAKYQKFLLVDTSTIASGKTTSAWDLGDGYINNTHSFSHKYASYGNYNIRLISISDYACRDTSYLGVKVFPMPKPAFSTNLSAQCNRFNNFVFTDISTISQGSYSRQWKFGDGGNASANPASHHFADTGTYKTNLILTSDKGCVDTSTAIMKVWPMPSSSFSVNAAGQCLTNNKFVYTNKSVISPGTLSSSWNFGDNGTSIATSPAHSYTKDGNYVVMLITKSDKNCLDTITTPNVVYPMPLAAFNISDSAMCQKQNAFNFTNKSNISSGSLTYFWKYGDGGTSNKMSPTRTYASFGKYTVKLIATSAFGCPDSTTKQVEVYPMPQVSFTTNSSGQCIKNQLFVFTDSSKIVYGTLSRKWNFGDSTSSVSAKPSKTFLYPKSYTIKLIETSGRGCQDSTTSVVTVYPKPYPKFIVNDTDQCFRGNQYLYVQTSTLKGGTMAHSWKFGDGTQQAGDSAAHIYSAYGTFTVTLTDKTNFNCVDSIKRSIIVYPMPKASFTVNNPEQCYAQNRFVYTNTSAIPSGVLTYSWKFGDTGNSVSKSPTHIYPAYGQYSTMLIARSAYGCADTIAQNMIVDPMPRVQFVVNDSAQCLNKQQFIFTDKSSIAKGTISRTWKFADSSGKANPLSRTFNSDTFHQIKLVEISDRGCMDSFSNKVTVHSKPQPRFAINDSEQCFRQNIFVYTNKSTIRKGSLTHHWDFGDAKTLDSLQGNHIYAVYGTYKVLLRSTSEKGCIDTVSVQVIVNPMPAVQFTINDTGQCLNAQSFVYTNKSTIAKGISSSLWKLGDGRTAATRNVNTVYSKDTNYLVWLTETSDRGCMDSVKSRIDVFPKPTVGFSINDSIQCQRQNNFTFKNNTGIKYGTLQYIWKFGDPDSAKTKDATHIYASFGNYNVSLKSTSDLGCSDVKFLPVIVGAMPNVSFTINDPGQCRNTQNFVLTNTSSVASGTQQYVWKFGDATTSALTNAVHVWPATGNYKPRLIATTNYSCMDSVSHNVWINPNAVAGFTTNDSDQCRNQQNYIFNNNSTISSGKIVSIRWDLGNGKTGFNNQEKSYYPLSGSYRIKIYTTSDSGCLDSFQNLIRVYPKPAAAFVINDSAQCLFQNKYLFSDISFDSFGVNIYNWNINNENIQTTKTASFTFANSGYKNITLISTSLRGCSDTIQRTVYVKPMPDAGFETLKPYYCELTGPINFTANTAGGNFAGKNIIANQYFPKILWKDTVKYIVTVNGCTDSSSQFTQVYPGPRVNLGNDTTMCLNERLDLNINSWQSSYLWNTGSAMNMQRITKPGIYSVTVTNICGVKSDTIKIDYRDINCRFFLPTAFTPNGDGINDIFKPVTYGMTEMTYRIFNRWGQKVYEGNLGDDGWDGTVQGEAALSGAYAVYVYYMYDLGYYQVKETVTGALNLVR